MENGRTNEQMMLDMFERRNKLLKEEYALQKEISSFLVDYKVDFGESVTFGSLLADNVFADHDSDSAIGMHYGTLILDTVGKDFKDLTDEDVEVAVARGQALTVEELSLTDLSWILDKVYKQTQKRKHRTFVVVREIVEDEKVVKTIHSSYSKFEDAVKEFHRIEDMLVKQGYELDDNTDEYFEEEFDNGDFFNNAVSDKNTVRIFIEELNKLYA